MKVIVTGVTGYIGARLVTKLVHAGHDVVAFARSRSRVVVPPSIQDHVTVVEGDLLKPETLPRIESCDVAYYLVHSLTHKGNNFEKLEESCAHNFLNWLQTSGCRQIIYLSGVSDDQQLSKHLASRHRVADILSYGSIPCTVLRAAVIVGSGSASFEIIRGLVEKLPFMVAPRWVSSQCQPIAIVNVVDYLVKVIDHPNCMGKTFDIGGPDVLTYKEMLQHFAKVRGLKRYILSVPVLTPRLSSYWLFFVTPVNFSLARSLVDSLKNHAVCGDNNLQKVIPIHLIPYPEAVQRAFAKIQANSVISSWKDSLGQADLSEFIQVPVNGCKQDFKAVPFDGDVARVKERLWNIGGDTGWYSLN